MTTRQRAPVEHLQRLLGADKNHPGDDVDRAWLATGFAKYLDGELPLLQALGLPGTPRTIRLAVRDFYLVRAAQALRTLSPAVLQRAALDFRRRKYSAWDQHGLPADAKDVDRHLFAACSAARLPTGLDQYTRILRSLRG